MAKKTTLRDLLQEVEQRPKGGSLMASLFAEIEDKALAIADKAFEKQMIESEKVTEKIKEFEERLQDELDRAETYVKSLTPIKGDDGYTPQLGIDFTIPSIEEIASKVKIPKPKDGKDGATIDEILSKLPKIKDGKDGSPDTGKQIIDKVNELPIKWDSQIDATHIRGLSDYSNKASWHHGGGDIILSKDISDLLDGVTKTFTIPSHRKITTVLYSSAPFFFSADEYTDTTTTITFSAGVDADTQLATGQRIQIIYTI